MNDDQLVDRSGNTIHGNDDFLDRFAEQHNVEATIFKKQGDDFIRIITSITKDNGERAVGTNLGTTSAAYAPIMNKELYIGTAEILGISYITAYDPLLDEHGELIGINFVGVPTNEVQAIVGESQRKTFLQSSIILMIVFLVGLFATFKMSTSISARLQDIAGKIDRNGTEVDESSNMVATSSKTLAENVTNQAALLQESTSALEEIAAQIKNDAKNAHTAEVSVKESIPVLEQGVDAMIRLKTAMDDIINSSQETSKVVNTINEIAFQTNLLALNAAVEAARAGEAGKGFAVVAEEVRNLAKRSSEAAQITSDLIKNSQSSSVNGTKVTEEVSDKLSRIEKNIKDLGTLIIEISSSAQEQSKGIQQINSAMTTMDEMVQSNAASSEESAGAAEDLSMHASELQHMVVELRSVITGNRKHFIPSSSMELSEEILLPKEPALDEDFEYA